MPRRSNGVRVRESGLDAAIEYVERLASTDPFERLDGALGLMAAEMTSVVPIRTGFLKSTAHHESTTSGDEWTGTYVIGEGVEYLRYVFDPRKPNELDAVFDASEPLYRAAFEAWWSDTD